MIFNHQDLCFARKSEHKEPSFLVEAPSEQHFPFTPNKGIMMASIREMDFTITSEPGIFPIHKLLILLRGQAM
jgi:hypothetical protein